MQILSYYLILFCFKDPNETGDHEISNEVIDVAIPIQCIVKDSKLTMHEHTKVEYATINLNKKNCRISL